MSNESTIVQQTITVSAQTPAVTGFNKPMVMGYHTNYTDRAREYEELADMVTDGFATTDPLYLAAAAMTSQNPRPASWIVGRTALDNALSINLVPTAQNSTAYTLYINGQAATYTSDATATVAEITAGLKSAIDTLATAQSWNITTTDNSTDLDVDAASAADYFTYYVGDPTILACNNDTTDGGIAADLAAIRAADDTWYVAVPVNQGKAVLIALGAAIEATGTKGMFYSSSDDEIIAGTASNVMDSLNTSGYNRVVGIYHHKAAYQFAGARWLGKCIPKTIGSFTWAYKGLSGLDYSTLTSTQITTIEGYNGNYYVQSHDVSKTFWGKVQGGDNVYFDITQGVDWTYARMSETLAGIFFGLDKVPYTNPGIGLLEAGVWQVIREGIGMELIDAGEPANDKTGTASTEPWVKFPTVADTTTANRAARHLPSGKYWYKLTGAIHTVEVNGTVTV